MNECAIHTPAYASFTNLLLVCLHANKTHMGAYECVCVHTSCIHKCVCVCVCACACVYITYYIHHLHTSLHIHAFTYTHILCTRTNTQVCVQQQVDIPTLMHAYNHDARATRRCVTQHKKKVHPAMPPTVESTRSNASYCYYCCVSLCVRACACVRACVCVSLCVCVCGSITITMKGPPVRVSHLLVLFRRVLAAEYSQAFQQLALQKAACDGFLSQSSISTNERR